MYRLVNQLSYYEYIVTISRKRSILVDFGPEIADNMQMRVPA